MPFLILIFAVAVFFTFSPPLPPVTEFTRPSATPEIHYTKNGIVHLNRATGATRFVPYRLAGELDRRAPARA